MRTRHGVSIVEVLVALLLFSLAALGTAAALTVSARAHGDAYSRREATASLQQQAATLSATRCASLAPGAALVGRVPVQWSVTSTDSLTHIVLTTAFARSMVSLAIEVACP